MADLDLLEICASMDSRSTEAVRHLGGKAGRFGLWHYNLLKDDPFEQAKEFIRKRKPRHAWASPTCGPFSPCQNMTLSINARII